MARVSGDIVGNGMAAPVGAAAYDAFISYSQRGDKAVARALRTVIQTIGKPWWKLRSLNVFLDATSLSAAPGLWDSIAAKLDRSRYLILLASPEAASSPWVDKEVAHFVGHDGAALDRLLIGLTEGDLRWDATAGDFAWDDRTPLPPSLRGRFRAEPLWVDLRPFRADPARATKSDQAFLHAALDLAATIKGVEKADLYSDELRQQRRSLRLAYGAAIVVAGLAVGAGIAALIAVERAEVARVQTGIAEAEADRATREADRANGAQKEAEAQRDEALRGRMRLLADLARQENEREDYGAALAFIREAVATGLPPGSYPPTLEKELRTASASNREVAYADLADHVDEAVAAADGTVAVRSGPRTSVFSIPGRRLMFVDEAADAGPLLGLGSFPDRIVLVHRERIRILGPDGAASTDVAIDRIDGGEAPIVVFSPKGDTFLIVRLRSVDLRRVFDGGLIAELKGFHGGIASAVFSEDGSRIATASADDLGRVWSAATGALLATLEGHARNVAGIGFVEDGGGLVTWSDDGTVRTWRADGSPERTFGGDGPAIMSAVVAGDGRLVLAADEERGLSAWNRADGMPLTVFPGFRWGEDGFLYPSEGMPSFSRLLPLPDSRLVALVDPGIAVLDVETLSIVATPEQGANGIVTVGRDRLAWTSGDDIRSWNASETGFYDAIRMVGATTPVSGLWGGSDGVAASLDRDGALRIWDVGGNTRGFGVAEADRVSLSPDGGMLVGLPPQSAEGTGLRPGEERSRPALLLALDDSGPGRASAPLALGRAEAVAFSPDSRRAALSMEDGSISVVDLPDGRAVRRIPPGEIRSPAFLPGSDDLLQTVYRDDTGRPEIRIWPLAGDAPPRVIADAILLGTSPDGRYVVAQEPDAYEVRVWDVAKGAFDAGIADGLGPVKEATFLDPDLIWSFDREARVGFVWSISRRERLWETALATGYDYIDGLAGVGERHVALHRLGRDDTYHLEILDKLSGEVVLSMGPGSAGDARFGPGDVHVAVSYVGVWDLETGEQVAATPLADVSFGADGTGITMLTRGRYRELRFDPLPDLVEALNTDARPLTDAERHRAFIE